MVELLKYFAFIHMLIIFSGVVLFILLFIFNRKKARKKKKTYRYRNNTLTLISNTLDKKIAMYFLLAQNFNDIINEENTNLKYEFVKPFDFTKIRENNIHPTDIFSGIILVCKRKELLPNIFECFVNEKEINYDFEKDYNKLSILAAEIVTDFFIENARIMLL